MGDDPLIPDAAPSDNPDVPDSGGLQLMQARLQIND
jgi:hypothetical protein